jgi:hypothetical protein
MLQRGPSGRELWGPLVEIQQENRILGLITSRKQMLDKVSEFRRPP